MSFKKFINLSLSLRTSFSTQLRAADSMCKFNSAIKGRVRHASTESLKADELLHNQSSMVVVPIKVLEYLLETNNPEISGKSVIEATNSLLSLYKEKKIFTFENKLIIEKVLNNIINMHRNKIQVNDAVEILKQLTHIKMFKSSNVAKLLVEIINSSLQDLHFKNYNVVTTILANNKNYFDKTINKNLKKHFIIKMSTDFDANDLDTITEIFRYSSQNINDKMIFQIIIDSLKSDQFQSIPITNAVSIMKSLCTMNPIPRNWRSVLKRIQDNLINNFDQVTTAEVQSLLYKITCRVKEDRIEEFYNPVLLDLFAQKIVSSNMDFSDAVNCLRKFLTLRHINKNLLSYISAKHYDRNKNRSMNSVYLEKLLCLVNGLAELKYKPIFWEEIYSSLSTSSILSFTDEMLVNYALHLSCLDCYDFRVLERIFQSQYNYEEQPFLHWRLLYLWQNLKINSNYNGPLPSQEMIDSFNLLVRTNICPVLPTLVDITGHERYIKTNLKTKLHHQVDHILVFEGKDKPVAINDSNDETEDVEYLEDLKVPDNSEIVAVLYLPKWWYFANAPEMLGLYQAYVQSLETLIRHVIVVPEHVWLLQWPEDSRTDILKNQINSKLYSVTNENS